MRLTACTSPRNKRIVLVWVRRIPHKLEVLLPPPEAIKGQACSKSVRKHRDAEVSDRRSGQAVSNLTEPLDYVGAADMQVVILHRARSHAANCLFNKRLHALSLEVVGVV